MTYLGPVVALALEREDAVKAWRSLMGPTNTAKVRKRHGVSESRVRSRLQTNVKRG